MKKIIYENQRGLLFRKGQFIKLLDPGKHIIWSQDTKIIVLPVDEEFMVEGFPLPIFMKDQQLMKNLDVVDVPDGSIALHFKNGRFMDYLSMGQHAFWKAEAVNEFTIIDMNNVEVASDFPKYILERLPRDICFKVEVEQHEKALLFFDKKFIRLLAEGIHYFWNNGTKIEWQYVDTRILQMDIQGQEIMTADKVNLRINFVCHYRIRDLIKIHTELEDYQRQLYILLQLILREYAGKYRLDEILENREELANYVLHSLKEKEAEYYVEFRDAGVKDIILPGEIRDIMNTVLVAEKKAQANVITRREEVASTRSLLNTAKLMEENKTLYKLKELEYIEKICDNIGNINVGSGGAILAELSKMFSTQLS